MDGLSTGLYCLLISILWGATNPLIKKSTRDITKIRSNNCIVKFINEIKYLVVNWRYVFFFLINQSGSVFYFFLLQSVDLSLIVPIVNALTFIFTGVTGFFLGEEKLDLKSLLGVVFIIVGITFCVLDKIQRTNSLK